MGLGSDDVIVLVSGELWFVRTRAKLKYEVLSIYQGRNGLVFVVELDKIVHKPIKDCRVVKISHGKVVLE
jgi:hypothetical protein